MMRKDGPPSSHPCFVAGLKTKTQPYGRVTVRAVSTSRRGSREAIQHRAIVNAPWKSIRRPHKRRDSRRVEGTGRSVVVSRERRLAEAIEHPNKSGDGIRLHLGHNAGAMDHDGLRRRA